MALRGLAIAVAGAMVAALVGALAACSSKPARSPSSPAPSSSSSSSPSASSSRSGGFYQDDGPGRDPPADVDRIADAVPRWEPLHRFANRPYTVLGRDYTPATELKPYRERGIASWYGRKFHQQKTSIGETYDMYAMSAAHPTLPLPSYARVTNLANGRSVVVRVNDRGPFLNDRLIDLSWVAAQKLGFANAGSARVEVESLIPDGGGVIAARPSTAPVSQQPLPPVLAAATVATAAGVATAAAAQPPQPLPLRFEGSQVWLQIGAFTSLDNAENFLSLMEFQLAGDLTNGNLGPGINIAPRVRSRDNLFRVEIGPYASREDAQRAGRELESRIGPAGPPGSPTPASATPAVNR